MGKIRSQLARLLAKRTVLNLLFGFLIYCLITAVVHYFVFWHPHVTEFGIEHWRDLTVALWGQVIFAATFGLLAAIISLIKPEEDSIDKRLGYLYPRCSTLSAEARNRLGKNAMKLAAPAVAGELLFVIEQHDLQKKAFWLDVYVTFTLRNILQDEPYDDEIEIHVAPDEVPGVTEIGRLHESVLTCPQSNPARIVHATSRSITAAAKRFQEFVRVVIPPRAEAIHSYHFSGWSLEGIPWQFNAQRYSEGLTVKIRNKTGAQVNCKLTTGTNNPTAKRAEVVSLQVPHVSEVTLGSNLIMDGNRDNLQLVITP